MAAWFSGMVARANRQVGEFGFDSIQMHVSNIHETLGLLLPHRGVTK